MSRQYNADYRRAWKSRNRDSVTASVTKWRKNNPEKVKAQQERSNAKRKAWHLAHPDENHDKNVKRRASQRDWYKTHKKQSRKYHLKRLFGMTIEDWNTIFNNQENSCAVCKSLDPGSKIGWHTDHNHKTGKVRGILCHKCNLALGCVDDNVGRLYQLAKYLEDTQ